MRLLLALVLALFAAPAAAQETPPWVGVWEGRMGTYPIRLCVDSYGEGGARGSYYYLSQLEPISLSEEEGKGGWIERAGETEAQWQFGELSAIRMRGTWWQKNRSLRFDLRPLAWSAGEWDGPCSSAAFLAPRLRPAEIDQAPADLAGWRYTKQTYRPPPHFKEDVGIETFAYPAGKPGDAAINAILAADLPKGEASDEFVQCLAGSIASLGIDGYFEKSLSPAMVSDAFLVVDEANSNFCGGAHPNHWQDLRTFDRQSGAEIDMFDWISAPQVEGEVPPPLAPALRDMVMARWPADAEAECREYVADTEYWSLGLARDGLVFQPDLPHVATPCEERVTVEWDALGPFLDAEGKAGLARLKD